VHSCGPETASGRTTPAPASGTPELLCSPFCNVSTPHLHHQTHDTSNYYYYYNCFTALVRDHPGEPLPEETSGYATVVHGRGCNPHRSWWRHNSETIRDRDKRRPPRPMKLSELSNGENRIALWQLLQNWKLHHLWRHNLGSRRKLQKMALDNFSIGAFYNITKNQDNPIKTVGRDSFLSPKTPKNTSF